MGHRRNPNMLAAFNTFIGQHTDEIAQRRHGLAERLWREFVTETGHSVQISTFTELVRRYRRDKDIEFVRVSKYYKPKVRATSPESTVNELHTR
jgi:hypothetical protein